MDARLIARGVALGRLALGAGLIAAPERFTAPWVGADARRSGTQVITRGLGARDFALGAGALASSEAALPGWVAAAVAADAGDLLATLYAGRSLPRSGRALVGTMAAGGAALGLLALAGLRGRG